MLRSFQRRRGRRTKGQIIMRRVILLACSTLALQACAKTPDAGFSHLGLPVVSESEIPDEDDVVRKTPPPELDHVVSNKVLGAMAFQKTTGRTVDPTRLQGSR
jgi:hypothetical protein